jgi:cytoskeleton protein RodZ
LKFFGNLLQLRREPMIDFGGKLRQARERRGISLRQIAASTKISVAALEALERNDVSKLPGGIFSRAFVKSYAVEVGLDPDEAVKEFLERFQAEAPPAETRVQHVPDQESQFESQQRIASVLLKLVTISVPLIVTILYFTLRSRPSAAPEPPSSDGPTASTHVPVAEAPAAARVTPAALPQAGPSLAVPAVASGPMRLELHPTGPCWVALTVDGKRAFGRLMQAGQHETRVVVKDAVIEVGDAGAFAFSVDGREGRPIGSAGEVKTLKVTRESLAMQVK